MKNPLGKYLPGICGAIVATPFLLNFLGAPASMFVAVEFLLFGAVLVLRSLVTKNLVALAGSVIATVGAILFVQQWVPLQISMGAVFAGGVLLSLGITLDDRTTKARATNTMYLLP